MEQSLSCKADSYSANQEISRFYEIRMFITLFRRSRHWIIHSVSWIRCTFSTGFSKTHINIPPSMPRFPKWSPSFKFCDYSVSKSRFS